MTYQDFLGRIKREDTPETAEQFTVITQAAEREELNDRHAIELWRMAYGRRNLGNFMRVRPLRPVYGRMAA